MKIITRFSIIISCIFLLIACEDLSSPVELKYQNAPGMLTVLFKADFSAWDKSDPTDATCGGYPDCLLTMEGYGEIMMEGYGEITHLDYITPITTRMTVCCNVETGLYHNMSGSFVDIHGDELYYRIHIGQIIPYDEDGSSHYQKESNDRLIFTGGTGRYEGASGNGYTNAYVLSGNDELRTDFFSTGILKIKKQPF